MEEEIKEDDYTTRDLDDLCRKFEKLNIDTQKTTIDFMEFDSTL